MTSFVQSLYESTGFSRGPGVLVIFRSTQMTKRVIRRKDVLRKLCISNSTLYDWIANGRFPAPFLMGAQAVGWLEEEVDAWLTERQTKRARPNTGAAQ